MSDFYMVLPSNSNPNVHPENTANKFNVSWETPIELDNMRDWKVALTEFSYHFTPLSTSTNMGIKVVRRKEHIKIVKCKVKVDTAQKTTKVVYHPAYTGETIKSTDPHLEVDWIDDEKISFKNQVKFNLQPLSREDYKRVHKHPGDVVPMGKYNKQINKWEYILEDLPKNKKVFTLHFRLLFWIVKKYLYDQPQLINKHHRWKSVTQMICEVENIFNGIFKLKLHKNGNIEMVPIDSNVNEYIEYIELLNGFNYILGFQNRKLDFHHEKSYMGEFAPQLTRAINHMYIYCSVCAPIQVGNVQVPLLKSIWLDVNKNYVQDQVCSYDIKSPMYVPINFSSINSVEVNIRTDSGALVPFSDIAVSTLTLHFKKNNV